MRPGARLGLGIGWRPELALAIDRRRDLGFVELLAEHVDPRAPLPGALRNLRERGVEVVVHSTDLSLGGAEPIGRSRLDRLARVAEWAGAACVSDHVAFVRAGGRGAGHLLPVPRTETSLAVLCENVGRAQRALPVPLALENVAALFEWPDPTMDEPELLCRLTRATGALLVADVSNLFASARNLGVDPASWLDRAPLDRIAYVHVGGGRAQGDVWHDTHAHPVPEGALQLLRELVRRREIPGAMLERDDDFPSDAEINRELDGIAGAMAGALAPAGDDPGRGRERQAAPSAAASQVQELAGRQASLIGALVAGAPAPAGFDTERLRLQTDVLLGKRRRADGRRLARTGHEGRRSP